MEEVSPVEVAGAIRETAELFDTRRQAVIGTLPSGEIVYWNRTAERLYGWSADEAYGRNILEVTPSDLSREQAEAIMSTLRKGRTWTGDFLVRDRGGKEFRVRVRDLPVKDKKGRLIGIVGTSIRVAEGSSP